MAVLLRPVVLKSAPTPLAVLCRRLCCNERTSTGGRVVEAGCVVRSALKPMAVLSVPVVRLKSASSPSAVLCRDSLRPVPG